jgi:hypothetical protein
MKFFSTLTLGMIVVAVDAAYPNPGNSPPDACYTGMFPMVELISYTDKLSLGSYCEAQHQTANH